MPASSPEIERPAVLVVDDDPRGIQTVEAALEGLDIELVDARNAEDALRELLRRDLALVLLDVRLGTTDGFAVAETIRGRPSARELPIIFLTAHGQDPAHVLRGYEVGAVDYISKPFSVEVLRAKVRVFVQLHRRTQEVRAQAQQLQQLEREAGERRLAEARREWETQTLRQEVEVQRELASRLEDLDRRKDEFIAVLAHELRNPLTPISTGVEFVGQQTRSMPTVSRACEAMRRQVDHLVRLVDDLLDVSRISEGKIELRREPVDVRRCIEQARETVRAAIDEAQQQLEVELPDTPLVSNADRARVTQIVTNLLANATRYTPNGGRIHVTAGIEGEEVIIRVRDNGIGLDPNRVDRLFEKFTQGHSGENGLGLGLTLVKQLTELHGGSAHATSPGIGKGSEFEIRLPRSAGAPVEVERPASEPVSATSIAPLRILVVDDEADIREMTLYLLTMWGHEVHTADSGEQAIAAAVALRPDLVMLDIGLPDINGYDVARRIRGELGDACPRLVAVTGYGQRHDRARSSDAGIDEHLVKPPKPEALRAAIERARAKN
jgi:signal transduction histidine kinase